MIAADAPILAYGDQELLCSINDTWCPKHHITQFVYNITDIDLVEIVRGSETRSSLC